MRMLFNDIRKHLGTIDWFLVVCVTAALAFGFIAVMSATSIFPRIGRDQTRTLMVQAAAIFLGAVGAAILSKADYMHIAKYWKHLYVLSVVALVAVRLFGVGGEGGVGNNSWFRIGPVGIQPSEFVKITFIITVAERLDKNKENINNIKNIIMLVIFFLIPFGLILWAGDLGNGLIYGFIFLSMCFAAGVSLWYFLGSVFVIGALSPLIWNSELLMPEYRRMRILRGFDPTAVHDDWTFQVRRSQQAIGSGGLFGQGWRQGTITQWRVPGRIPEQWTDFIFSAIGEEFGFVGAILVLIILTLIVVRILMIARTARNNVGSLICMGVMAMLIAQIIVNLGMTLGLLPVIGITLPFFSYGGSSILSSLLCIGLVLGVNSRKNIYYFRRDENLDKY